MAYLIQAHYQARALVGLEAIHRVRIASSEAKPWSREPPGQRHAAPDGSVV